MSEWCRRQQEAERVWDWIPASVEVSAKLGNPISADTSSGARIQSQTLSASCRLLHCLLIIHLILLAILKVKPWDNSLFLLWPYSPCLFIVGEGYSHIWAQDTIPYRQCLQTLMCTSSTSSVVQGTCLQNQLDALWGTPWSMGYSCLPSTNCHWTWRLSVTPRREVSQVQLEPVLYYSTSLTIRLKFWLGLSGQTVAVLNVHNPLLPIFLAIFELPIQNSITSLDLHLLALLNARKSLLVMPLSYYQSSWPFSSRSYRAPLPNNIPLDSHLLPITIIVAYITHLYSLSTSPQATFHSVNGSGARALQSTFHTLCIHHWW